MDTLDALPWLIPGLVVALAAARLLGGRLATILGVEPSRAQVLAIAVGLILAATLTPDAAAGTPGPSLGCDLARWVPPGIPAVLSIGDPSLNILLFVPLGAVVAGLPRHIRAPALVAAAALPVTVELIQLAVPVLGRGCESADVVDNLTGLAIGLALPLAWRRLGR